MPKIIPCQKIKVHSMPKRIDKIHSTIDSSGRKTQKKQRGKKKVRKQNARGKKEKAKAKV